MFSKNKKENSRFVSTMQAISKDVSMEFGIQEYGRLVLKRMNQIKSQGITPDDGEVIKKIG